MITINDRTLVFNETFLLPDGQSARFDTTIEGTRFQILFTLRAAKGDEERKGTWAFKDGILHMTFIGWTNPMGTCLKQPEKLGDINGKPLGFQLCAHAMTDTALITFMLFLGGTYE